MLRRSIYLFLTICSYVPAFGQNINYQIFENIHLGSEASVVNSFIQDRQGMIWIGTDKGLFSYDGYSVQPHFSYGERSNSRIYCGMTVGENYLYLGSDNGLLIYNYHTDRYENPGITFPMDIRAMVCRDKVLWIGTLNGLYTYDFESERLERIDRTTHKGLTHETIYSLIHSADDRIYIGTYDGLSCYLPEKNTFETISLPGAVNKSNLFVNSLLEDTVRNCIWIGTEGNLFRYDPSSKKVGQLTFFHENSVKTLALDQQQNLLAGTDNGLYIYQAEGEFQHVVHDSRNSSSLSNNIVWTIFTDKEKNIWLGTDYGISLSRFNNGFQYVPISQITGTGEGNHFYSLFKDSHGYYWFGGTNGLIRSRSVSGQDARAIWYKMGNRRAPLSHNRVRNIYEDKDRNLWIATDGSINRYDYATEQFVHYNIVDSTGTYNCNWAYYLFEDNDGYLWIASFLGGIFVVDKQKLMKAYGGKSYVADYHYSVDNGLPGMFVNQLIPDHEGNIWMLLYNNGVTKINTRTRRITRIPVDDIPGSNSLNYILCDGSGVIWAGFRRGVMRFMPGSVKPDIVLLENLGQSEILSMIEVEQDIWVSTTDGLWTVHKETMDARHFHVMDKAFTSLYYDPGDRLVYMGGVDGLVITSPEIARMHKVERPITITALYVNNRLVTPEDGISENGIRYARKFIFGHTQNNLSFEISDLSYSLEEKPKFMYKLTSVDQDWNLLKQNTNRITYHNLKYGSYQLLISGPDPYGKPSDQPYTIDIRINPPWYYTAWAKAVYILLTLTFIFWIINFFRVRNRLKFERLEKEKILEQSQSKIDFFTHISHDFKTPLSLIVAPVSKLLLEVKNPSEKKQLEIVQRNARKLNSLIHQVLDFNRIDDNAGSVLILSKVEFISFARSLLAVYEEEITKEKQVALLFESNLPELYLDIDVLKFESILGNLLSNAFKYTSEGGEISLSIHASDTTGELEITVSDNGIGIPEKDLPYIFQRFFQSSGTLGKREGTGIGLYLVKSYTELHGGKIRVVSEEGRGTSITLILPLPSRQTLPEALPQEETRIGSGDKPLILVVDDNADITGFICETLQPRYRCKVAENGKAGVELCFELQPDLIIADVMMPVMNGLEMCQRIKKHIPTSTIPIILLTVKNDKETELESIHLHIDAFIGKPFEPEILLSRVEQLLLRKQQMEAKARMEIISEPRAIEAVSYDEKFLSKLIRIIEDHVSNSELNVNRLSELSGINSKQIYRKTKQLTGMSPVEYIKSIRMKKAAMLLRQKKFTVAEVMYMVGYSNHSYFSKCFQAEFGKTPRQFMEEHAGN
jgi:signal transduction histidine kinase/ligand-binding sensor domain-containing protein/DNA-binding response OmpR family regulator